jgi:hypothetical protein
MDKFCASNERLKLLMTRNEVFFRMLRHLVPVRTDVSVEIVSYIIRVARQLIMLFRVPKLFPP